MQAFKILRGCLAAWLAGVLLLWLYMALMTLLTLSQAPADAPGWLPTVGKLLVMLLWYGGVAAGTVTMVVMLIWAVLAMMHSTVHWRSAPLVAGIAFGVLAASFYGNLVSALMAMVLGLVLGAVFWAASFGRQARVTMHWRPASDPS